MGAPNLDFTITNNRISSVSGFDYMSVSFSSDIAYQAFQCRATKIGEDFGVGIGTLIASFSQTPAGIVRTFEIYDSYLVYGEGEYRISLFAQSESGAWNDGALLVPFGSACMRGADSKLIFCAR